VTSRSHLRGSAAAAAIVCLAAGLVACGSSSGKSDSKGGVTHLTVGSAANLENVGLYHGTQSGIFAKNGLSVTPKVVTSGQQAVPQLLNGQLQFTATDPLGAILAISHKVPLVMVAPAGVVSADPAQDSTGLLAKSNVSSLAELDGKTIAVNSVGGLGQLAVEAAIDQAGGHSSTVKWVELPQPQMTAAVKAGRVFAAAETEPYVTEGKDQGLANISSASSVALAGIPYVLYATSKSYATSHPSTVAAFATSLYAANGEVGADPKLIRTIGAKSTSVSPEVINKMVLPPFSSDHLSLSVLNKLQDLMVKYKLLPAPLDLSQNVYSSAS